VKGRWQPKATGVRGATVGSPKVTAKQDPSSRNIFVFIYLLLSQPGIATYPGARQPFWFWLPIWQPNHSGAGSGKVETARESGFAVRREFHGVTQAGCALSTGFSRDASVLMASMGTSSSIRRRSPDLLYTFSMPIRFKITTASFSKSE
jgi:hypothetical protein